MRFAWKVTLSTLGILVFSFALGSCLLISLSFRSALQREVGVAQDEMQMLRISYEAVCAAKGVTLENIDTVGRRVDRTLETDPYFSSHQFRVTTGSGKLVFSSLSAQTDKALLEQISGSSMGYVIRRNPAAGQVSVHCAGVIFLSDGELYMESVRDITGLFTDRETHYSVYRWLLLLITGISALILLLLSSLLTHPIRSLAKAARQLTEGDYTSRSAVTGSDEIGNLARDFNNMADAIEKNVQELEDARQRQEEFTASFVHELKTPLTSIIGYADILRSRQLDQDTQIKAAGYIFSEGKRLESLSLSLMSLMAVGHGSVELHEVSMTRLFSRVERTAAPALAKKQLSLSAQAEEFSLLGDESLLETLLLNLIDNARKASPPGTDIALTGCVVPAGYRLTVADHGRGIPAKDLDKITDAFYMVDKSRSRAEGGAGLGLALSKQIVAFHNGAMRFFSRGGEGTTVEIVLGGAEGGGQDA